jgi:hypothetical protein
MKTGQDLTVTLNTRVSPQEAAEWHQHALDNQTRPSLLLRELVRQELAQRNFQNKPGREEVAAKQVLELFAETMAMSLEGPDLANFMRIVQRIAPDSEFARRAGLEAPVG